MIRSAVLRRARRGAVVAGTAGILVLAGCSGAADADTSEAGAGVPDSDAGSATGEYTDGTYTAQGAYQTPETVESVSVTVTLEGGVVTEVEVTGDPQSRHTVQYQGAFIAAIGEEVEGVRLDDLDVSRVAGSSLTSGGFTAALAGIREQATE